MGKTNVYAKRTLVLALIKPGGAAGTVVPYGFLTNVESNEYGVLGITVPATGTILVLGTNLPKPTRMTKKEAGYSVSCFASTASIAAALAAKWKVTKAGNRYRYSAGNVLTAESKKSVAVYVPMTVSDSTFKYAWRIPSFQAAKMGTTEATELGIKVPTTDADARDMLFGVNNMKPARASKTIGTAGSDTAFTMTTFYDTAQTLTTWKPVSAPMIKGAAPEF